MKLYTYTTAIILDPFAGTGTTGVAAANTRRKFICVDISKEYCDTAIRRIGPAMAQRRIDDYMHR
jgi:site-specific DNA-methyltransferase (adenine-specific)